MKRSIKSKRVTLLLLLLFIAKELQYWRERYPYILKSGSTYSWEEKDSPLDETIMFLSEREPSQLGSAPFF